LVLIDTQLGIGAYCDKSAVAHAQLRNSVFARHNGFARLDFAAALYLALPGGAHYPHIADYKIKLTRRRQAFCHGQSRKQYAKHKLY